MKTKEEIIEELISQIKTERWPPPKENKGGQSVGVPLNMGVKLTCENTDFQVYCGRHRSQLQNAQLCLKLYKQYLEEII